MTIQAASVPMELRCVLYPTLNYAEQTAGTRSTSIAEMVVFPALIHAMARVIRTRNFVITAVWCAITTNQFATSNITAGRIIRRASFATTLHKTAVLITPFAHHISPAEISVSR